MKAFLNHHSWILQEAIFSRIEFCWINNKDSALGRIAQSWAIWQTFSELLAILKIPHTNMSRCRQMFWGPESFKNNLEHYFFDTNSTCDNFAGFFTSFIGNKSHLSLWPSCIPSSRKRLDSKSLLPQGWNPTDAKVGPWQYFWPSKSCHQNRLLVTKIGALKEISNGKHKRLMFLYVSKYFVIPKTIWNVLISFKLKDFQMFVLFVLGGPDFWDTPKMRRWLETIFSFKKNN